MNSHEVKALNEAISLIGWVKTWRGNDAALDTACVRLQILMDCGQSLDTRQLASTVVEAFDLMDRIEVLRQEAAA